VNLIIVDNIVEGVILNLKEFGYKDVNSDNIFTDYVYSRFFKSILNDNVGNGYDEEIKYLLSKLEV
jgi:hypothetical protein